MIPKSGHQIIVIWFRSRSGIWIIIQRWFGLFVIFGIFWFGVFTIKSYWIGKKLSNVKFFRNFALLCNFFNSLQNNDVWCHSAFPLDSKSQCCNSCKNEDLIWERDRDPTMRIALWSGTKHATVTFLGSVDSIFFTNLTSGKESILQLFFLLYVAMVFLKNLRLSIHSKSLSNLTFSSWTYLCSSAKERVFLNLFNLSNNDFWFLIILVVKNRTKLFFETEAKRSITTLRSAAARVCLSRLLSTSTKSEIIPKMRFQ